MVYLYTLLDQLAKFRAENVSSVSAHHYAANQLVLQLRMIE